MHAAQKYGGLIWTNHALERLTERGLPQDLAWQAYRYPDSEKKDAYKQSTTYRKRVGKSLVSVIIKETEKKELLVVSAWVDPPMLGTDDYTSNQQYRQRQKAGFFGKFWLGMKRQLGL